MIQCNAYRNNKKNQVKTKLITFNLDLVLIVIFVFGMVLLRLRKTILMILLFCELTVTSSEKILVLITLLKAIPKI